MGCISTPIPNYLLTCLSLFYYSSFDEWGRVETTPGRAGEKKRAVWER